MKKFASILLGLSLVIGSATVAFSQAGKDEPKKESKKKGKKTKKTKE